MGHTIPLIRAAVIHPFIRWMEQQGRPVAARLGEAGLGNAAIGDREVPVPLASVFALFRLMADAEGPDIAARAIGPSSLLDFGNFGQVILGSRSPRDALSRVMAALPRYSTHEQVSLWPQVSGLSLHAGWALRLDDVTMHLTQQFTAALACALCAATGLPKAAPHNLRILPHPEFGLCHLRPWFGAALGAASDAPLEVDFADLVLDAPLHFGPMTAPPDMPPNWDVLKGDGTFCHSARLVLGAWDGPAPALHNLAAAAGMSPRSVQRTLTSEGTSFRQLLDDSRRNRVLRLVGASETSFREIATDVGFADQAVLSHAVRRWTGATPSFIRLSAVSPQVPLNESKTGVA